MSQKAQRPRESNVHYRRELSSLFSSFFPVEREIGKKKKKKQGSEAGGSRVSR